MKINWNNSASAYGIINKTLRWWMVLLMVATFATLEFKSIFAKDSDERVLMANGHYLLGLSILILVWPRLWQRYVTPSPVVVPAPPVAQKNAQRGGVVGQTFSGWSLQGHRFTVSYAPPVVGWCPEPVWGVGGVVPLWRQGRA